MGGDTDGLGLDHGMMWIQRRQAFLSESSDSDMRVVRLGYEHGGNHDDMISRPGLVRVIRLG